MPRKLSKPWPFEDQPNSSNAAGSPGVGLRTFDVLAGTIVGSVAEDLHRLGCPRDAIAGEAADATWR